MKRKSLFAVALLLILSSVAFSNERTRYRCGVTGNLPCPAAAASSQKTATLQKATAGEGPNSSASHMLLRTIIKLLYI
jgi:hypothetical protein